MEDLAKRAGTLTAGVDKPKATSKSESSLREAEIQDVQLTDAIDDLTYVPPKHPVAPRPVIGRRELHERMSRLRQRRRKGIAYLSPEYKVTSGPEGPPR